MKKIVFFGSGGGGNMKFIHKYSQVHRDQFEVVRVITDRECGANEFAKNNDILFNTISFKREKKEDSKLIDLILKSNPDYVISNVHKILSPDIVNRFKNKLINLHYSYLPAFQGTIGMKPVDQAVNRNNLFIGCTVHYVNELVDDGKTISQGIVIRRESKNIYQSVFECGALSLLAGIFKVSEMEDLNYKSFNEYIISPFSSSINVHKIKQIFQSLQQR